MSKRPPMHRCGPLGSRPCVACSTVLCASSLLLALAGCAQDPRLVASNCADKQGCAQSSAPLRKLDKVDILLVIDNSDSVSPKQEALKQQLPRMLNALTTGQTADMSFPPAASVNVAVVTTDMGVGSDAVDTGIASCVGLGQDGTFVRPGETELAGCEASYPGFLAYDGSKAALATVDTVACVPVVGTGGCGFEQPLEAALKALWPAGDDSVSFLAGAGHGEDENAGFLRPDSLLVVVVVTDEDDCSVSDPAIFTPPAMLPPESDLAQIGLNARCALSTSLLYPTARYEDGLRALRPDNDNLIFAVIAGIPQALVPESGEPDYAAVLDDPTMQVQVDDRGTPNVSDDKIVPACAGADGEATPPRRLVEIASGFGANGVLSSICADDFGETAGRLIRAIGTRLADYAKSAP